jgi:hypothetical protein
MHREIAEQWIAALRSGKYEQGRNTLRDGDSFCCLGVLCDLYGATWIEPGEDAGWICKAGNSETAVLPNEVREWAGLIDANPQVTMLHTIAELNDGVLGSHKPWSFDRIANLIEEKWSAL